MYLVVSRSSRHSCSEQTTIRSSVQTLQADPVVAGWDGQTAFHIAAEKAGVAILRQLLLRVRPTALDELLDVSGNNPLHLAVSSGSVDTCKLLLDNGMKVDAPGQCLSPAVNPKVWWN